MPHCARQRRKQSPVIADGGVFCCEFAGEQPFSVISRAVPLCRTARGVRRAAFAARRNATVSIPLSRIWGILMQKSVSDGKLCLEIVCERVYHIIVDGTTCRIRRGDRNSRSKSFAPRSDGFRRITEELPTDANDSRISPLPSGSVFIMRVRNETYV